MHHPFIEYGRKGLFLWPYIGCLLAGVLSSYAMAPTYFWPGILIGFGALYFFLSRSSSKISAFILGWLFGFGYFVFGLHWIGNALLVDGNPYQWAWPLAVAGLPFLLSFFPALACLLAKMSFDFKTFLGFLGFVATMAATEWLRGHIFTGFPWNLYGYAWGNESTILQSVSLINSYGLTFLTIMWGSFLGFAFLRHALLSQRIAAFVLCLICVAGIFLYGFDRLSSKRDNDSDETVQIRLVQPNIPQSEKWDRSLMETHFYKQIQLSLPNQEEDNVNLIIWPETAISQWFLDDPISMHAISQLLKSYDPPATLLTGALRYNREKREYYNSMIAIDDTAQIFNIYDKHHLVPFGEYIPFQKWIPLKPIVEFSGFKAGDGSRTYQINEISYSPAVCYEVIFPGALIEKAENSPTFIINITNDAWYGRSAGPYQHYKQAVFRAVEENRFLIRVANTGFTGVITPFGYSIEKSSLFTDFSKVFSIPLKKLSPSQKMPESFTFIGFITIIFLAIAKHFYSRQYLKL